MYMYIVYLYISTEGEVLPHGVALKPIVCEDTTEVRMVGEEHTIHVPHLQHRMKKCSMYCYMTVMTHVHAHVYVCSTVRQ